MCTKEEIEMMDSFDKFIDSTPNSGEFIVELDADLFKLATELVKGVDIED